MLERRIAPKSLKTSYNPLNREHAMDHYRVSGQTLRQKIPSAERKYPARVPAARLASFSVDLRDDDQRAVRAVRAGVNPLGRFY